MPAPELVRRGFQLGPDPAAQLFLGQDREAVKVVGLLIIGGKGPASQEALVVKGNVPGGLHQLPDPSVLDLGDLLYVLGTDRIPHQGQVVLHGIEMFHAGIRLIGPVGHAHGGLFLQTGQSVFHDLPGLADDGLQILFLTVEGPLLHDVRQTGSQIGGYDPDLQIGHLFSREEEGLEIVPQGVPAFAVEDQKLVLGGELPDEGMLRPVQVHPGKETFRGKGAVAVEILHQVFGQIVGILGQDIVQGVIVEVEGLAVDVRQVRYLRNTDIREMVLFQHQLHKGRPDILLYFIETSVA